MKAGAERQLITRGPILPGLILVLFLVGGASAIWDYFRVDAITRNLAMREVQGLIYQVEQEIESAAQGERTARAYLEDHLFGAAWLMTRLESRPSLSTNEWEEVAAEAGVLTIDLFDRNGKRVAGTENGIALSQTELRDLVDDPAWQQSGELSLGVVPASIEGVNLYTVGVERTRGGMLLVSLDAEELTHWRSQIGLGPILEHLETHPEVSFATLSSGGTILAATPGLPSWVGGANDPFLRSSESKSKGMEPRFADSPDGDPLFEASTTLASLPDVTLRLALRTDELRSIRHRSLVALSLRTVLFILLAGITIAFLISRQNERLLTEEAERIRREVERLEADRTARERLEAMGKLAGGVAHEIRNPLNTVEMVAQRLELEFEPTGDHEEYKTLVGTMRGEAKRIGKIVQDFLAFARPPATNKQPGSLEEVIGRTVTLFRPMAEAQGVEVEVDPASIKPFAFDHEQVGQALQNLLRNALEAVPNPGGKIRIASGADKDFAWLEVADNGPGIPQEERVRVFHLYHTTKAEGTGVGLSLVHRIADEHGGRVDVSDTPGGGATLKLWLKREAR